MLNNFAKIYKIWIKSLGELGKMPFLQKSLCTKNNKDCVKNNKKYLVGSDTMYLQYGMAVNRIPKYIRLWRKVRRHINDTKIR